VIRRTAGAANEADARATPFRAPELMSSGTRGVLDDTRLVLGADMDRVPVGVLGWVDQPVEHR
jgi:hypothetical protein